MINTNFGHVRYGSSTLAFTLKKDSKRRPNVPELSRTPVVNVSAYIQKIPNLLGDNIPKLDAHLAQAPTRQTTMGVNPKTEQASLILMSSFT